MSVPDNAQPPVPTKAVNAVFAVGAVLGAVFVAGAAYGARNEQKAAAARAVAANAQALARAQDDIEELRRRSCGGPSLRQMCY